MFSSGNDAITYRMHLWLKLVLFAVLLYQPLELYHWNRSNSYPMLLYFYRLPPTGQKFFWTAHRWWKLSFGSGTHSIFPTSLGHIQAKPTRSRSWTRLIEKWVLRDPLLVRACSWKIISNSFFLWWTLQDMWMDNLQKFWLHVLL